jgi:hypothetical protein
MYMSPEQVTDALRRPPLMPIHWPRTIRLLTLRRNNPSVDS